MKKAILYGMIAVASLAAPALTSCLDSDTPDAPSTFTATLNPDLNFVGVKDIHTGDWKSYPGGTVRYMYDFETSTMQFGVTAVAIAPGQNLTFSVPSIPLTLDKDGAWVASHQGPFTVSGGGQTHTLTDLKTYLRLPQNASSILMTEFTIDDEYLVRVFPNINYFGGTTRVTLGGGTPYTTDFTYYDVFLTQKTMTAEIFAFQAKFIETMPAVNIVLPGVPFELTDEGLKLKAESLTPCTVTFNQTTGAEDKDHRVPRPDLKVVDLEGKMVVAKSLEFSYSREDGRGTTAFSGTPLVKVNPVTN